MVVPAPEEEVGTEDVTPLQTEDSDSGESHLSLQAVRVTHEFEAFSGRCFCCNKVGHHCQDEECEMYDPDFLNFKGGPARASPNQQVPGVRKACKTTGAKASQ